MRTKGFGEENIFYLSSLYFFEEQSDEDRLEMEEYLKNKDSKKFKEFMKWKKEMEIKYPNIRDILLGREDPPLHCGPKKVLEETSFLKKIYLKIQDKLGFHFQRYCFHLIKIN